MTVKINIDHAKVLAKVDVAWSKGTAPLAGEILADCNEYVKRSPEHTMRDSSLIHSKPGDGLIVWETPYAKRQYWEIQTALTPGTTWRWIETAKRYHLDRWKRLAQRGFIDHL